MVASLSVPLYPPSPPRFCRSETDRVIPLAKRRLDNFFATICRIRGSLSPGIFLFAAAGRLVNKERIASLLLPKGASS